MMGQPTDWKVLPRLTIWLTIGPDFDFDPDLDLGPDLDPELVPDFSEDKHLIARLWDWGTTH
jgi:hypothetical protein